MRILEKQTRSWRNPVAVSIARQLRGIEIKESDARRRAWLVPITICVTCGHKRKLARELAERGGGQSADIGLPLSTNTTFEQDQKMARRHEVVIDSLAAHLLHELGGHSRRTHHSTADLPSGGNRYNRMSCERDLVTINIIVHPRRLAGTGAADRQQHSLTRFCEGGVS